MLYLFLCVGISSFIENINGADNFKNDEEEKSLEILGAIITSVFLAFIGELFNNIYAYLIPFVFGLVIGIPYLKYLSRMDKSKQYNNEYKIKEYKSQIYNDQDELLDKIDNMSGQEFEKLLIEKLLPLDNYSNINGTNYTGDYGVDIIAEKK